MKTLQMIPITKKPTNMLAHAENSIYEVIIRYWGDEDVSDLHLENVTADDINIFVDMKVPANLYPKLDIVFSDEIDNECTRLFMLQFDSVMIRDDQTEAFIKGMQTGKDTLDDIKTILKELVPHLMTDEQFKESEENIINTGRKMNQKS